MTTDDHTDSPVNNVRDIITPVVSEADPMQVPESETYAAVYQPPYNGIRK